MQSSHHNEIGQDTYVPLDLMLAKVQTTLNIDATALSLRTDTNKYFYLERNGHHGSKWIPDPDARLFFERLAPVIKKRQIIDKLHLFENVPAGASLQHTEKYPAYYAVPVDLSDDAMGILEVFNHEPFPISLDWMTKLTSLADEFVAVISRGPSTSTRQDTHPDRLQHIVDELLQILSLRDIETELHSQRSAEMTLKLVTEMGVSGPALDQYKRGALLHDIGKIAIPDDILLKPAPLTEAEWIIMRKHPVFAYEFLSNLPFVDQALDIPHYHHEKWDGSGYPNGLRGKEIPFSALAFAIIDVWDSLCSEKPFRPAWSKSKAREYIVSQSEKHFDPEVVKAFLAII
ncbi:MAG: HD domain-containing protein [Anaerolineales bacterium]|nr:HD domain-containing protein [Anaerolineales bacterium]